MTLETEGVGHHLTRWGWTLPEVHCSFSVLTRKGLESRLLGMTRWGAWSPSTPALLLECHSYVSASTPLMLRQKGLRSFQASR